MPSTVRTASIVALMAAAAAVSACSQSPVTSGAPATASGSPSTSAPTTSAPSSASAPASASAAVTPSGATSTVVVTATPSAGRTVTQVVQAPQQDPVDTPRTSSSLRALYEEANPVDSSEFYSGGGLFFDAPSQNIGCYLADGDYVACSIHRYDFDQPGPDCDRGIATVLDSSGYPTLSDCSGYFPVADRGAVLQYGDSITDGDVACVSASSGVSCIDLDSDTGFTLSRETYSPVSY